jgi:hypothetical protein
MKFKFINGVYKIFKGLWVSVFSKTTKEYDDRDKNYSANDDYLELEIHP